MKDDTVRKLNQINTRFYEQVAISFSQTRQCQWKGWERLVARINKPDCLVLKMLDVGCGNGRFGEWVAANMSAGAKLHYLGIDNNKRLLVEARERLEKSTSQVELAKIDLVGELILSEGVNSATVVGLDIKSGYDLISCFGVMHHVPGRENREKLMRAMSDGLAATGVLVVSLWQFRNSQKLRDASDTLTPKIIRRLNIDLEENDFFLGWKKTEAVRFCHHVNDEEVGRLVNASGLTVIDDYVADGRDGKSNRYIVLQRELIE